MSKDLKRGSVKRGNDHSTINFKCGNNYPKRWGESPDSFTQDEVKLPLDYGYGSLLEKYWIIKNIENDYNAVKHIKSLPSFFYDYWRMLPKIN